MLDDKRSRGRPRGSGIDDTVIMARIADILVRNPALKPTTAMRNILIAQEDSDATSDPTMIRRWQRKWKKEAPSQMAAAKERARPSPVRYAPIYTGATLAEQFFASHRSIQRAADQFFASQLGIQRAADQLRANEHRWKMFAEAQRRMVFLNRW
jgi:hypothetical protein